MNGFPSRIGAGTNVTMVARGCLGSGNRPASKAHDIYVLDLHADTLMLKSRNFR